MRTTSKIANLATWGMPFNFGKQKSPASLGTDEVTNGGVALVDRLVCRFSGQHECITFFQRIVSPANLERNAAGVHNNVFQVCVAVRRVITARRVLPAESAVALRMQAFLHRVAPGAFLIPAFVQLHFRHFFSHLKSPRLPQRPIPANVRDVRKNRTWLTTWNWVGGARI